MTTQLEKANLLKELHVKGSPLILFNIWDAGSAKDILKTGVKAIGTSSWSVAAAQGYDDGQELPFALMIANLERIIRVVNIPVTVDIEAGYAHTPSNIQQTISKVIKAGAVGINLEDQIIGSDRLYSCVDQCERIKAARDATEIPIFINARTDIFLQISPENHNVNHLEEALFRASAYNKSGADSFFAPGLQDEKLIKELCNISPIPVNVMITANGPTPERLVELGVSRISYGPSPYCNVMRDFIKSAKKAMNFYDVRHRKSVSK